jgi:hypothetical protein
MGHRLRCDDWDSREELKDAETAAINREIDLKQLYVPTCQLVIALTVDPRGAVTTARPRISVDLSFRSRQAARSGDCRGGIDEEAGRPCHLVVKRFRPWNLALAQSSPPRHRADVAS